MLIPKTHLLPKTFITTFYKMCPKYIAIFAYYIQIGLIVDYIENKLGLH